MNLKQIASEIHQNAVAKGWWEKDKNMGEMLMLCVSELVEAMEADRIDKYTDLKEDFMNHEVLLGGQGNDYDFEYCFKNCVKNTFEDELADTIIRILDICHSKNIDIEWHIRQKMRYNSLRPYKHGGKKY